MRKKKEITFTEYSYLVGDINYRSHVAFNHLLDDRLKQMNHQLKEIKKIINRLESSCLIH